MHRKIIKLNPLALKFDLQQFEKVVYESINCFDGYKFTSTLALTEYILFIYFMFVSILLTRRKATEAIIHRPSNYPDVLPEMPRHCCPLEIFYFGFLVLWRYD